MNMARFLLSLLLILPTFTFAQVYRYTNPDGSVTYTDKPQKGAKEVKLPKIQVYSPPPTSEGNNEDDDNALQPEVKALYNKIAITSPTPQQSIWNNIGLVDVSVDVDPPLAPGDKIAFYLDDKMIGETQRSTQFSLQNVTPGTHNIQAKVTNEAGEVIIESESVTFYMHRASVNMPTRPKPLTPLHAQ